MKELIKKIKSSIHLTSEAEEYLFSISKEKTVSKGEILIRQGQSVKKTIFVTGGCLRSYCIDKNGKEHTLLFAIKNWWIGDGLSLHSTEPASLTVESLVNSVIIEFNTEKFVQALDMYPEFETYHREKLERHIVVLYNRVLYHLQLTAQERYELFLEGYPDIEQYSPDYHIASYLGITRQSLSRIRSDKAKKAFV